LKWPNDLLFNGKKTAGILCEADDAYFYGGIGVNCNQVQFPEGLQAATSLLQISGAEIDLSALLIRILERLKYYSVKANPWRENFDKILYKKGEMIEIREGQAVEGTLIRGKNLGIGSDGQLLIECKDGNIEEIYAGEIEK
ncbi:MAG: bifunctional biotin--[acetyl-CoA-carboxylase] synthetase/biotin operon repressor, partial [Deltaproteobacteria bacterium]|nr:bifunctional biotin--[acetyl-CoA-carboxylase] synthetase/biotin operon repressor [Deltaproteobacteria bacterium]